MLAFLSGLLAELSDAELAETEGLQYVIEASVANCFLLVQTRSMLQLKYDGMAISLLFKDGKLVRALTRGDGEKGQAIDFSSAFLFVDLLADRALSWQK